jgi:hypothetical protein
VTSFNELAYGPRLKIERARHHIRDFNSMANNFMAERPFKLVIEHKPMAREFAIRSKIETPIPEALSLVIGDAIHNLAAALDYVIYAIASGRAPSPHKLMFPFPREAKGLCSTIDGTQVRFAGSKVIEAIRALKPYPGGNEALSGLHRLDTRDKHRLLILTARVADFSKEMLDKLLPGHSFISRGEIMRFIHTQSDGILFQGRDADYSLWHAIGRTEDFEQEADLQPPFQIAFGKGQPFEHQPVNQMLDLCADAVDVAVAELIRAFLDHEERSG